VPSTLRVLAKDAVVIGDGRHPPARLGADGCESGMKRLPILLTITTGLALASVLGLNATLELQTNWLQRWLKQKVQREEGVIKSPGSRHVRRCIIRQGGTYDRGRSAALLLVASPDLLLGHLLDAHDEHRSEQGLQPAPMGLLACILPLVTVIILLLLPSRLQA
jgi:hypothetical protein